MTKSEADQLRRAWKTQGHPPCKHGKVELERTDQGYLTGRYLCVKCGAEVTSKQVMEGGSP